MNGFTLFHVLLSLAGIAAGFVAVGGWLAGRHLPGWSLAFLLTTAATSLTGFLFPFKGVTPGIVLGVLSLIVLAVAAFSVLVKHKAGRWLSVFTVSGVVALYFNFFVLVAQLFQHTPALRALAPTQAEPAFGIAQGLVFVMFVILGVAAVRRMAVVRLVAV